VRLYRSRRRRRNGRPDPWARDQFLAEVAHGRGARRTVGCLPSSPPDGLGLFSTTPITSFPSVPSPRRVCIPFLSKPPPPGPPGITGVRAPSGSWPIVERRSGGLPNKRWGGREVPCELFTSSARDARVMFSQIFSITTADSVREAYSFSNIFSTVLDAKHSEFARLCFSYTRMDT